jgi:transposase
LDECVLKLFPTRSWVWAKRGVFPVIPLLDRHGKLAVFGAAGLNSGTMVRHLSEKLGGAGQVALLERLAGLHPTGTVLLIWDNGPTHRNKQVSEWLAAHPNFICYWLPPYSGADVNPIEHCWKWLREHVTHNHLFTELDELRQATERFFDEITNDRVAVLSRLGQM